MEICSRIRGNIAWMEYCQQCRRAAESTQKPGVQLGLPGARRASNSQARLPKPEYVTTANLIGHDDKEIEFYAACELGLFTQVETFIRQHRPSQAVRQYGLELASFAIQPTVAQFLLEQGTILHEGVVRRSWNDPGTKGDVNLFDTNRAEPLPMVRVFLAFGWDPNQMWSEDGALNMLCKNPVTYTYTVKNTTLLEFLLSNGTAPKLSVDIVRACETSSADSRDSQIFDVAIKNGDPATVDLLVRYGFNTAHAHPLHSIACWGPAGRPRPFTQRRLMAEKLLLSKVAGIDDIKQMTFATQICGFPRRENMSPFIYACAAQDWEYVEWLLEKGADPYLLNGRAFDPLVFMDGCYARPSDPRDVMRLVDKVQRRRNGEEAFTAQDVAIETNNDNPSAGFQWGFPPPQ